MTALEIHLEKEYNKKLGMGPTAKKIFQRINEESEVILNFENIEFMSRSFAQEYISQKHHSDCNITEINMPDSIENLLKVVDEDFEKTYQ